MGVPDTYVCFSSIKNSLSVSCYGEQRCCCYDDSYHAYPSCCSCATYWWLWALVGLFVLATGASILAMYLRRRKRVHGSRSGSDILFGDRPAFNQNYAPKLEEKDIKVERQQKFPEKLYVPSTEQRFMPPNAQQNQYIPPQQQVQYLPPPTQPQRYMPQPQDFRYQHSNEQRYVPPPQYIPPQDQKYAQNVSENRNLGYRKEGQNDNQYGKLEEREIEKVFLQEAQGDKEDRREE